MQVMADIDAFVAAPVGRYVTGRQFVYLCRDAAFYATVVWGRPDAEDTARMVRAWAAEARPEARAHGSLFDAARMEAVEPDAFGVLRDFFAEEGHRFGSVTRQALVRPEGLVGAIVSGFYDVLPPTPYPHRIFADAREALGWLGRDDAAEILGEIEALVGEAQGTEPILRGLREVLATDLAVSTLESAARRLGLQPRTLQRRLRDAGTSFRAERGAAQVRKAQALLRDTDIKLTAVAFEVGCASLQHFSSLFRKLTGTSPSAWRAQVAGRGPAGPR